MIDTKALRSKVLDLAIQGKLTEQYPDDEDINLLLKKIPEVSNKRKSLLKKEYEYNAHFDIPDNWKTVKLGEISSYGDTPIKAVVSETSSETWILELEDIRSGGELICKKRVHESKSIGEKNIFKKGQVLYSKLRPYLKKILIADENGISTPELVSFDVYGNIYPQYIVYYLLSSSVDRMINNRAYGIKMPRVDSGFMANLPVPLPPSTEQKRIVERVEEIFKLLDIIDDAQKKYSSDAEILKNKLISMGIQGKLTEQLESDGTAEELYQQIQEKKQKLIKEGKIKKEKPLPPVSSEEIPFEIPRSWKWVRLGNLSSLITKGSSPKWQGVNYTDEENGILFVTSENVGKNKMLFEKRKYIEKHFNDSHQSSIIQKGDILTNIVGASIGRTAIFDENIENANINQAVCVIRLIENSMSNYVLRYMNGCDAISLMLGKTVDTARANLSLTSVSNLIIPLPPLAEQKRIADKLDEILRVIG